MWKRIAKRNTEIYEKVFRCIPTDSVHSFQELKAWESVLPLAVTDKSQTLSLLQAIQGHLVEFPMDFLKNEELNPPIMSMEGIIPYEVFT